jgi:hypothetical protein
MLVIAFPALSKPAMFLFSAKKSAGDLDFSVSFGMAIHPGVGLVGVR